MEIVGLRHELQARETKRLMYSRAWMNAKVFEDGIIHMGSVIQMPDTYDSNEQQGYITWRADNVFDTSEPVDFTGDMFLLVTDSLRNSTRRYPATPRSNTHYGFVAAIPDIQLKIWNSDTVQFLLCYLIEIVVELRGLRRSG